MVPETEPPVLNVSDAFEGGYREAPPAPGLERFVECLWTAGGETATDEDGRRILPDGRMDLVWIRGAEVLIAGPQSQFTLRPQVSPLVAVGVRFHPGAAPSLLRLPAAEFVDGHVPLDAVVPRLAGRLLPALEAARSPEQAFAAFNRELLRHLDDLAELDAAVAEATWMLDDPRASVGDVAARVYLSERQLRRRFTERVGYGPKTLQRVLRFQRFKALAESPDPDLARAAAEAGYADQAHLAREVRELAGLTPRALVRWLR
jgi:AraC-like DNA-binding protein